MRAAVTGASGLVGGNLALALLASGHSVRATRRETTKTAHLEGHPIEWVGGDLNDRGALTDAFRGIDVVFHCAALVSSQKRATPALIRTNVDGTRNVVDAVRAARVSRLVHCSTVNAVGLSEDGQPCDEGATWNFDRHGMADGYATTKHMAEGIVREAVRDGVDAVIANPTFMIGPYDARPSSGRLVVDVVRGKVPGRFPGKNNFVDVRDVVRGMLSLATKGKPGDRYILGGDTLSYAEIADRIARIAGTRAPRRNIPPALAAPYGWFGDLREALGGETLVNTVTLRYAYCHTFIFTSAKAERELGYRHGPLDDAIRDAIAWFRQADILPAASG
jgi:dihydroflavonol-4-reductase